MFNFLIFLKKIEPIEASHLLNATLRRREKYMNQSPKLDLTNVGPPMTAMPNATDSVMFQAQHGVYQVFTNKQKCKKNLYVSE